MELELAASAGDANAALALSFWLPAVRRHGSRRWLPLSSGSTRWYSREASASTPQASASRSANGSLPSTLRFPRRLCHDAVVSAQGARVALVRVGAREDIVIARQTAELVTTV